MEDINVGIMTPGPTVSATNATAVRGVLLVAASMEAIPTAMYIYPSCNPIKLLYKYPVSAPTASEGMKVPPLPPNVNVIDVETIFNNIDIMTICINILEPGLIRDFIIIYPGPAV